VALGLRWVLLALVLLGAGCGGKAVNWDETARPRAYEVRRGDTLYSIAFRHRLDHRELARWNGIKPPYRIKPGQQLTLVAPSAGTSVATTPGRTGTAPVRRPSITRPTTPATKLDWAWPGDGPVLSGFRAGVATARGLDIGGARGAAVRAAADGRVVYAGSGLVGFGRVIIVKHDERWLSAYAHVEDFEAREEDSVRRGQRIATMGLGPGQRPMLHFEIRLDGQPVDPAALLPKR
jgi:lipoprotein NlpD